MSRYPTDPDEGQYYNNNQPYLVSDPAPPIAPHPGYQSPPPPPPPPSALYNPYPPPEPQQSQYSQFAPPQAQQQPDWRSSSVSPAPPNTGGYSSPPPPSPSPYTRFPQSTSGYISPPPQEPPIPMSQITYSQSSPAHLTAGPGAPSGPRARFDSNNTLASSHYFPPTGGPQPLPSPHDPYADPGYGGDDWHPSRASISTDEQSLLPTGVGGRGGRRPSDMPGQWDDGGSVGGGTDLGGGGMQDEDDNIHYGPVPSRVPRRNKTVKRVQLYMGHLVLDSPVPSKLLVHCPNKTEKEFTTMRYTAATCDPNDFKSDRYALRQNLYETPRRTELFIVLTMYNEDDELFLRTLRGVMQNIDYLCTKSRSKTWSNTGWQKVVVCVVSDGRTKVHPRTLAVIQKLGCYQPGQAKNVVNGKPVVAHIYEYTTQFRINSKLQVVPGNAESMPVQLLFCLKEKNQKKLNSHRWFFNAFGPLLSPNVCVLIDVGTQPGPRSIYHLWKSFDVNSDVGGACGEIVALKGPYWSTLLKNPLVAAQNFEYKMSNILDKPLESIFGFISVLPGAFSAYRYIAVQNDEKTGEGPLQKYFLGELHDASAGIFDANMYLAEDRILCWELVSKRGAHWTLHYVKSAEGVTDVPDSIPDLVSQRRRWLNGSFFASLHATFHFYYLYRSNHSFIRKFFLHILILYQAIQLIFSWFAIGNYFIAFYVLTASMESFTPALKWLNLVLTYVYCGLTIACFLMALGNRPKGSKIGYTLAFVLFAVITLYMTFAAFWITFQSINVMKADGALTVGDLFGNAAFVQIILSLLATYGVYILASLIHYDPWHMITSFVQYMLIAPSYISVMNVYAFCNTHDVSWGTKGQDKVATDLGVVTSGKGGDKHNADVEVTVGEKDLDAEYDDAIHVLEIPIVEVIEVPKPEDVQEDYYKGFRTRLLLSWVLSNGFLVAVVLTATSTFSTSSTVEKGVQQSTSLYLAIVLYTVLVLAVFRFGGSVAYMIVRLFSGE